MAHFKLVLPKMGESVAEATITKWLKQPGDTIEEDDTIAEIATDKVDSEVPSPVSGTLVKYLYNQDEVVQVGAVIAVIEVDDIESEGRSSDKESPTALKLDLGEEVPGFEVLAAKEEIVESPKSDRSRFYSPLVKSIAFEEGISEDQLELIQGTGVDGRVTKNDILSFVKQAKTIGNTPEITPVKSTSSNDYVAPLIEMISPQTTSIGSGSMKGDEIIEMDRMRKLIASHMVMSKQVSPHVTSFVEADVTGIVKWRDKIKADFEKREGQKITYTPIFLEAVAKAIKDFPMINVSVDGDKIIKHRNINIGLAAALPSGNLIVPVIKNTDQLSLVGLTRSVNDLAVRARGNKLLPDEVKDGTFTFTNIGSFGNVMGVPIINQPQVAILAVGTIEKKPAVVETELGDVIAIRHKMFLSMSYDHRVVDGALGGKFIRRVADYLEAWDINANY